MENLSLKKITGYSFLFGLFLLAIALPWSKFLMSLSEIILLISWVANGNLLQKIKQFVSNKTALVISSIFLLHIIGLFYTSDFNYGLEDVRKKIPLLLLPLIFSTSTPLKKEVVENILFAFVVSVIIGTFTCFYILLGYTDKLILQPQQASVFISHIRFSLLICLSIFILGYFLNIKKNIALKIIIPPMIIWLILFLIMTESETGLICTAVTGIILFIRFLFNTKINSIKIFSFLAFVVTCCFSFFFFHSSTDKFPTKNKNLPSFTKNRNVYLNDTSNFETENGNYVWQLVCEKEIANEWNKKSSISYSGKDLQNNEIKYTLIRFLTSKGLAKDSEGVNHLSEKEIRAIEKGIPNVNYMSLLNPTARIEKIIWEFNTYLHGGNPSGHSVVQRIEFWKAAVGIIKENFLFGVGTGDVENAFDKEYEKINSPLTKKWRLRSHNQFLAIGTAFGIVGIIWFLISLFYPLFKEKKYQDYFYLVFFIIAFLSMLTEDTLESQAGVTFFAFFNSFFLFCRKKE